MRRSDMSHLRSVLAMVLLAALVLTGCGSGTKTRPTVDFSLEQSGESLIIRVETTNFKVPTDGHAHIRLDNGSEAMAYGQTYTIPKVEKGKHTVSVQLSDVSHNYLGVKQVKE